MVVVLGLAIMQSVVSISRINQVIHLFLFEVLCVL